MYIYERINSRWEETAYIKPPNDTVRNNQGMYDSHFGTSVKLSNNTLLVGAPYESGENNQILNGSTPDNFTTNTSDHSSFFTGAAYVFVKRKNGWKYHSYIKPINSDKYDLFGEAIDLDNVTIAVNSSFEDSNNTSIINDNSTNSLNNNSKDSGAVYIYKYK